MVTREDAHVLETIPFSVDRDAFRDEVRMDAYPELADELERYLDRAEEAARPRGMVRVAYVGERDGDRVELGGERFQSEILVDNLQEINRVFTYAATCGRELYELDLSDLDSFASFWHDTLKTQAVHTASTFVCDYVRREFGVDKVSSMNPGSGDVDVWPIQQQEPLFRVLEQAEREIGVELTDSNLMIPDKSVSGIFFASDRAYVNCEACTRKICPDRRAPYRPRR